MEWGVPIRQQARMTKTTPQDSTTGARAQGAWVEHVKAYRKEHSVTFKDALKGAGGTYTKQIRVKKEKADHKPNPWMQHIDQYKEKHPSWKETMSYKQLLQACKVTYTKVGAGTVADDSETVE